MSLFKEEKTYPHLPEGDYEVVLRCSICNGEQVICLKDRHTGELRDFMLWSRLNLGRIIVHEKERLH